MFLRIGAILSCIVLLAACGGARDGGEKPTDTTAPTTGNENNPPASTGTVVASKVLDEDSAGDSIVADLPNGTKVDLYFPKYSVREKVDATVSTLPTVNLPTGTVVSGVRLLPDGLKLSNTAVLTLKIPGTLDQGKTLAFAIHNGVVSWQPVKVRHITVNSAPYTQVNLPLDGFSDHGIVSNADPAVIAAAISINTPPLERLYAQLASISTDTVATGLLADFFNNEVKHRLETAADAPDDPVRLETAMRMYLSWREQMYVMQALYSIEDNAGLSENMINTLLKDAINSNIDYWNGKCGTSKLPADAKQTVTSWLWAPAVFLDRQAPLRKEDLLAKLCIKLEILGTELDALLDSDQGKPLLIKTGLQVLAEPRRHDVPVRVRTGTVIGGSVTGAPTLTNSEGVATLTATVAGDNPGIAAEIHGSAVGFADLLDQTVRIFRPRNGGENKLIGGRRFSGTVKEYFIYGSRGGPFCPPIPTDGACAGQEECAVGGTATHLGGEVVIAGNPLAYEVDFIDRSFTGPAGEEPLPVTSRFQGDGGGNFHTVGALGYSRTWGGVTTYYDDNSFSGYIRAFRLALSIDSATGDLTGQVTWPCHRQDLAMRPAP